MRAVWTQKNEHGGYELAGGNRQKENGEWINTPKLRIHRLCAVAWFGLDAVEGKDVHHRINIPWLNVESNLLPLPSPEHRIITGDGMANGHRDSVVDSVLEGL